LNFRLAEFSSPTPSDQFNTYLTADMTRHTHERFKRHVAVFWIKYAIQLSPARMHPFRQRRARQANLFHGVLDPPRKNFLDRLCLEFLKLALSAR
jgi:hypothetical protein